MRLSIAVFTSAAPVSTMTAASPSTSRTLLEQRDAVHDRHLEVGHGQRRPGRREAGQAVAAVLRPGGSCSRRSRKIWCRTSRTCTIVVDDQDVSADLHVRSLSARTASPRLGSCRPAWPRTAPRRPRGRDPRRSPASSSGRLATPKLAVTALPCGKGCSADHLADAVGVEPGAGLRGLDEQHRELVAAVAGHHVDAARVLHEDLGHRRAASRRPTAWPNSSLTALKPSRSRSTTDTGWLKRR